MTVMASDDGMVDIRCTSSTHHLPKDPEESGKVTGAENVLLTIASRLPREAKLK
jgi:hypothetical protein